ncbi:hypothetical protein [Kutzneria albida]|uniref:Uncharacterized protein n=1 Tax=Kutzneria albida DSM 43870 TaxID=1449976 RepID=W5W3G8_9PSEU|nr:hypothetical protein [Kutzneria albida]AHH95325.1 hypothetical protein KALB_1955 [Kutzneria albida DSM 43870]
MAFRWRYSDLDGNEVPGPDEVFEDRQEAEDWLSAEFSDLADAGVDQVTLLEGADVIYGPMSLHAP